MLSSRVHLGAHSRKKAVKGLDLVEKILDQIPNKIGRRRVGTKVAKGLLLVLSL